MKEEGGKDGRSGGEVKSIRAFQLKYKISIRFLSHLLSSLAKDDGRNPEEEDAKGEENEDVQPSVQQAALAE